MIFTGGRLYPKACTSTHESSPPEEILEPLGNHTDESRTAEEDSANVAGTSASSAAPLGEGFAEGDADEDVQDNIVVTSTTAGTSKSNGYLPSLLESDDSELEDFLDDILERGRNMLKKDSTVSKILTSAITGYLDFFFAFFCSLSISKRK